MFKAKLSIQQRIDRLTIPIPECGCLVWLGSGTYGYGNISINGVTHRIHRFVYETSFGPIPDGLHVLHKCDVRPCINPRHLYIGTHDNNMNDRQLRNRQAKGEKIGVSRLTADKVKAIRTKYDPPLVNFTTLAKEYGVSDVTIHAIINRRTWNHL